ncbi:MAG TPA: hypothetical protein PKH97_02745, partial [Tetrasphaera sp.]|uniref:hypothetical protein n=1 Tax=Nostocoides sp. TaxID=1917966 RepID=UPI002C1B58AB
LDLAAADAAARGMTYAVAKVSSPPDSRSLPGPVTDPVAAPGPVVLASESAPGRGDEVRQVLGLAPLTAVAMPGRCEDPRAGTLLRRTPESIEIAEIADALSWTRAQCHAAEQSAPELNCRSGRRARWFDSNRPSPRSFESPVPPSPVPNLC